MKKYIIKMMLAIICTHLNIKTLESHSLTVTHYFKNQVVEKLLDSYTESKIYTVLDELIPSKQSIPFIVSREMLLINTSLILGALLPEIPHPVYLFPCNYYGSIYNIINLSTARESSLLKIFSKEMFVTGTAIFAGAFLHAWENKMKKNIK